jgi:hypothetical protein
VGWRNHRTFLDLLANLIHECEHLWSDTDRFSHRAESLVAMLASVA